MIIYLLICGVSIFVGQGVLYLIGVHIDQKSSIYLAPVMALVIWTLFLGCGVLFGFEIKQLWIIGWLATFLLALIGMVKGQYLFLKDEWVLLAGVVTFPAALMFPYFWHGITTYPGSWFWDGWAYIAYGQYIWEYPRGMEGGLAPLYQYAVTLNSTRFIGSSLIAFFSPITGVLGDTQAASGYFLTWSMFVFSSACMLFAIVKGDHFNKVTKLFYLGVTVFSGWLLNMIIANNYDNALAITALPAFAGVIYLIDPVDRRWALVLGGVTAQILYCYPEMTPFVLGGSSLFVVHRIFLKKADFKKWLILLGGAITVALIFTSPWLKIFLDFLNNQLNAATAGENRPGNGYFPQLLRIDCFLGAFWGYWSPFQDCTKFTAYHLGWKVASNLISAVLFGLFGFGLVDVLRRREWGLAAVMISLLCGMYIMIVHFVYDYGAYKFLLLSWWAISYASVSGVVLLLTQIREKKNRRIAKWSVSILFVCFILLNGIRIFDFDRTVSQKNIRIYRQVEEIKKIVKDEAVIVNTHDPKASEWALYFLRDIPLYLSGADHPYYKADTLMKRARSVDVFNSRYLLSDDLSKTSNSMMNLVWSGGPYRLLMLPKRSWILLNSIRNTNGIENWEGEIGFWMGTGETELNLLSSYQGQALLHAYFLLGPSLPNQSDRHLLVSTDNGYEATVTLRKDGPQAYAIPVIAGINRVSIRPLDKPSLSVLPNGDSRHLLVGVKGLKVIDAHTMTFTVNNPNGIELWAGEQGFWIGTEETKIQILAPRRGRAVLAGEFIPGPSLPDQPSRRILISADGGYETTITIEKSGPYVYSIPVAAGMNQIIFRALDQPTITRQPNGDTRPLVLGIKGLRVSLEE